MSRRKIVFLATEDWFVASHFRPLLKRAVADGFEVIVAARDSGALAGDSAVGVAPLPFARGALAPGALLGELRALNVLLRAEKPDIVHAIALKPIALALLSDAARNASLVLALTGRGYLEARGGWRRLALNALAGRVRAAIARRHALLLTENEADQDWVRGGADFPAARMMIMPGAGVDPNVFQPAPEPSWPPIIVGVAARLVRSKGIDVAIDAITQLRKQGMEIELRVAGAADSDNPEHVAEHVLAAWRATPGVHLVGRASDVNTFWANTHLACLPSRGGEGLPRSLLEAAACGRPIVTTDAPGCREFVSEEIGIVAPRNDAAALAQALQRLAGNMGLRKSFGAAARAKVVGGYTEEHAAEVASQAWRRVLARA